MLFTTPLFLFVFLPLFLGIYFVFSNSPTARNVVALIGSLLFFAFGEPVFVFALFGLTYIDYCVSRLISPEAKTQQKHKKTWLALAIILNLALLIGSKYLNFITATLVGSWGGWIQVKPTNLPLILGISFITFHKISYLVDSYKGRAVPPRNFLDCALYIFLFPQLIAGPIIRYHDIGSQIHDRKHTAEGFLAGFFRFSVGLSKKILIGDPLGHLADKIFNLPLEGLSPLFAWGGIVAYSLQIYFDFSGYSDMAIGLGRLMGFRFPENFNRPYIARSVTEFWRRWHISLSNWMRLYLYIPLGGNRGSVSKTYLNLWIVFLISGIWHGASWNFVVWGAYYGFFLCMERALSSSSRFKDIALPNLFRHGLTLLIVMIGWVFFRSPTLGYAMHYLSAMFALQEVSINHILPWGAVFGNRDLLTLFLAVVMACVIFPSSGWAYPRWLKSAWSDAMVIEGGGAIILQFAVMLCLFMLSVMALSSSDYSPFLYFRF